MAKEHIESFEADEATRVPGGEGHKRLLEVAGRERELVIVSRSLRSFDVEMCCRFAKFPLL
jgi:hypothetical protein